MNKLNIGYDHYDERKNFHNGAPNKDCDWLEYRDYHGSDTTEIDVNTCNEFYIFPINALWAKTNLFEKETFFGHYLSEKVIKDLQTDKCLLHINWIMEVYRFDEGHMYRLYSFLSKNNISPKNILISSDNFQFKRDFNKWNEKEEINILELSNSENSIECTTHYRGFKFINEESAFNNKLRHSHFLSVGFAPHQHRVDLVDFYEKEDYGDDKILWSALWKNKTISDKYHWPVVGDIQEEWSMEMDLNSYQQNPYLHSYVEIVAETVFDGTATQLSSGPFKSIANLQPFIYVTSPGGLEVLKSLGYKTFEPFIDESYDGIEDKDCYKYEFRRSFTLCTGVIT